MIRGVLAVLILAISAPVGAETYETIHREGYWTLYHANDVNLSVRGEAAGPLDGVCLAEGNIGDASLQIALFPPELVQAHPELDEQAWIQVSSAGWNFRKRRALAIISAGVFSLDIRKAEYEGQSIKLSVTEFKPLAILLTFAGGKGTLDVLDWRNRLIQSFPTDGLSSVRDKLFDCAGRKWP